jgi:hypothetical protein
MVWEAVTNKFESVFEAIAGMVLFSADYFLLVALAASFEGSSGGVPALFKFPLIQCIILSCLFELMGAIRMAEPGFY